MNRLALRRLRKSATPYLLITPALILVTVFLFGIFSGVIQSFGIVPYLGKTDFTLDYYAEALNRSDLLSSIAYSFYLALASSFIALIGGIALSAALTKAEASRYVQLLGIQIPLMTAHILVVLFVISIFSGSGLFPRVLYHLGIISAVDSFPSVVGELSGWGILLTYAWKEIPFIAFCTVSIMMNISSSYDEAAATLGASPIRTFFMVTLPLCKAALTKAFLVVFAFAFGAYEVPFLLGPTLPKALSVLAYFEFQNPDIANRSYSMVINSIMVLICSILALIYFIILKRESKD